MLQKYKVMRPLLLLHFFYLYISSNISTFLSLPKMNSAFDIAFEQISGNYWWGVYGDFKVIIMKDCGFINASRLCKDGGTNEELDTSKTL